LEEQVRQGVENYKEVGRRMEELSESALKQFEQEKDQLRKQRRGRREGSL
jgi:hypothetical protein